MTKIIFALSILFLTSSFNSKKEWTESQLNSANTAINIKCLSVEEKEIIKYLNLARLYPKDFAEIEVAPYNGNEKYGNYLKKSKYKKSLLKDLEKMESVRAIQFNEEMYELAKCFAKESGKAGKTGHSRKNCEDNYRAECCDYGHDNGREIILALLIDHDVPSLGHREICLSERYSIAGPSIHKHKKYGHCAVLDFK